MNQPKSGWCSSGAKEMFAKTEADCRHLSAIAAEERTRAKVQQMNIRPGQSEESVETIMICVEKRKGKEKE